MPDPQLTHRQLEVVDAIDRLTRDRGFPPTVAEVGDELGVCGQRAATLIGIAEARGLVKRDRRIPRSLRVVASSSTDDPQAGRRPKAPSRA